MRHWGGAPRAGAASCASLPRRRIGAIVQNNVAISLHRQVKRRIAFTGRARLPIDLVTATVEHQITVALHNQVVCAATRGS